MSILIDTLKNQHSKILSTLKSAQDLKINTPEGRELLINGKDLILNHLEKEDLELYPKLSENEETKQISHSFSGDMKKLIPLVLDFFEKAENNDYSIETAALLGKVYANLKFRIEMEEKILYPAYEEII